MTDINECILGSTVTLSQLIEWMETNIGPRTWAYENNSAGYAEGDKWFIVRRANPDDGSYRVVITDYSQKIEVWYTELKLRWG